MLSRGDNKDFLLNIMEYLHGATDLGVKKVSVKKKLIAGEKYRFKARVLNCEFCYSLEAELKFYISKDKKFQASKDILLGTVKVSPIKGKKTKQFSLKTKVPGSLSPGKRYVLAVISGVEPMLEVNEDNNLATKRITIY